MERTSSLTYHSKCIDPLHEEGTLTNWPIAFGVHIIHDSRLQISSMVGNLPLLCSLPLLTNNLVMRRYYRNLHFLSQREIIISHTYRPLLIFPNKITWHDTLQMLEKNNTSTYTHMKYSGSVFADTTTWRCQT